VRLQFQTKKPVAAAQNPPIIQRTFFIELPLFIFYFRSSWHYTALSAWMRQGSDVLLVCEWGFEVVAGTTTLWVWIRFDSVVRWELERV
jgi:hypothetical protein